VRLLVATGADLDVQDQDLWTALHWAAHKGHAEIVQLLISKGADLTLRKRVSGLSVLYRGGSMQQLSGILPFLCVQNGTAYECACSEDIRALFPSSTASGPAASPLARAPPQSNPASPAARSPAQSASSKAAPASAAMGEGPSLSLGQQLWHSVDRGTWRQPRSCC
jgi:ankyrin repeat protein